MPAQMPMMQPGPAPVAPPPAQPKPETPVTPEPEKEQPVSPPAVSVAEGTTMLAPMPGMIVNYEKNVGDSVTEGETVVILEAMKMENALPAPTSGTIKSINFAKGDSVGKNDVLCVIG